MQDLDTKLAAIRALACGTILIAREIPRETQTAFIVANLEGAMAAAVHILGSEAAYNAVQPLVDRLLSPALGRA